MLRWMRGFGQVGSSLSFLLRKRYPCMLLLSFVPLATCTPSPNANHVEPALVGCPGCFRIVAGASNPSSEAPPTWSACSVDRSGRVATAFIVFSFRCEPWRVFSRSRGYTLLSSVRLPVLPLRLLGCGRLHRVPQTGRRHVDVQGMRPNQAADHRRRGERRAGLSSDRWTAAPVRHSLPIAPSLALLCVEECVGGGGESE